MFKVSNKDTRTTPAYFTLCSSVSVVSFEQVNAGLDKVSSKLPGNTLQYFLQNLHGEFDDIRMFIKQYNFAHELNQLQ